MSYLALARKWRPRRFSEVIGQEHVVSALSNALNSQRIHHAFLFSGTRGVGKTTLARIFARNLNCEQGITVVPCGECLACRSIDKGSFIDLIEVDAASRTRVDDTRELLDNVQYMPTQGRYKIYLIDEVHMLSTHSFNALLKTLEEPPEHVKFLLATTDPQKLPATILSRCIQFNLKAMDLEMLIAHLKQVLGAEQIEFEDPALHLLARSAHGSVRDALSLLDQAIAHGDGKVQSAQVRKMLGMVDSTHVETLLKQILENDCDGALDTVSGMAERSADYAAALDDLLLLIHNAALFRAAPAASKWKEFDTEAIAGLSGLTDDEVLQLLYQIAVNGKKDLDYAPDMRSGFEMIVLRMLAFLPEDRMGHPSPSGGAGRKPESGAVPPGPPEDKAPPGRASGGPGRASQPDGPREPGGTAPPEPADDHGVQDLCDPQKWENFIESTGMVGPCRELMRYMAPASSEGNRLDVALPPQGQAWYKEERVRQIEEHCRDTLKRDIRLNVKFVDAQEDSDAASQSPAIRARRIEASNREALVESFLADETVRSLTSEFGAQVDTGSIKPGAS